MKVPADIFESRIYQNLLDTLVLLNSLPAVDGSKSNLNYNWETKICLHSGSCYIHPLFKCSAGFCKFLASVAFCFGNSMFNIPSPNKTLNRSSFCILFRIWNVHELIWTLNQSILVTFADFTSSLSSAILPSSTSSSSNSWPEGTKFGFHSFEELDINYWDAMLISQSQ